MSGKCQFCGAPLSGKQRKWCSRKCKERSRTQSSLDDRVSASRTCTYCGKPLSWPKKKWCDSACVSKWRNAQKRAIKDADPTRVCLRCGEHLVVGRDKWCSRRCQSLGRSPHARRRKPTEYKLRRREHYRLRRIVLAEANGTCSMCGGAATHVHHRVPLRDGGQSTLENLMALCPSCHFDAHPELKPSFRATLLKIGAGRVA